MAAPKPRTTGVQYGPSARRTARPNTPQPKPLWLTPTAQRTLLPGQPGAVPGAYAPNISVRPRWAGSHWATGRGAPVRTLGRKAAPANLSPAAVAKRIKYGY